MRGKLISAKAIVMLCFASFIAGSIFTTRTYTPPSTTKETHNFPIIPNYVSKLQGAVTRDCDQEKQVSFFFIK